MKKAYVLLAEGFEDVEAITPIDYLRRAGIEVTVLGVGGLVIRGSRGVSVRADAPLAPGDAAIPDLFDAIVIPGGMPGAANLAASPAVVNLVRRHASAGKIVAAICAAPAVVLHEACGLLEGRRFTGYPGTEKQVRGGIFAPDRVVRDENIITSRAAGTAGEFAVSIIAAVLGDPAAHKVAESVLLAK